GGRMGPARELVALVLHLAHEVMEMHAVLAHDRHAAVEEIEQKALAAPDAAVEINALRQRRTRDQALQARAPPRLVRDPFLVQLLQARDRALLRGIGREA